MWESPAICGGKDLERAVEQFQAEPDAKRAHAQWKQVESSIFGVQFKSQPHVTIY